ncbi:hypothetical protein, partial [Jannaschia sp. Os4]|uniref:hypothetical protein n=1 Tax=Jannaschia sp. Os4 TaxID=2807617 RepID=UPI001EEDFA9C
IRTARSRTSGAYLFDVFPMAPSSHSQKPPRNSGRFRAIFANKNEWANETRGSAFRRAVPILGGRTRASRDNLGGGGWRDVSHTWFRNGRGAFQYAMYQQTMDDMVPEIRPAWLTCPILDALIWIRSVRGHRGDPTLGYGMQAFVDNRDGAGMVGERGDDEPSRNIPAAAASAIYEVGPIGAVDQTVDAVMRDMAGAFGNELNDRKFSIRWSDHDRSS